MSYASNKLLRYDNYNDDISTEMFLFWCYYLTKIDWWKFVGHLKKKLLYEGGNYK